MHLSILLDTNNYLFIMNCSSDIIKGFNWLIIIANLPRKPIRRRDIDWVWDSQVN